MKAVTYLHVYKTEHDLEKLNDQPHLPEMSYVAFEENECTDELLNEIRQARSGVHITSLLEKAFAEPKKQGFVIMKFGDK